MIELNMHRLNKTCWRGGNDEFPETSMATGASVLGVKPVAPAAASSSSSSSDHLSSVIQDLLDRVDRADSESWISSFGGAKLARFTGGTLADDAVPPIMLLCVTASNPKMK